MIVTVIPIKIIDKFCIYFYREIYVYLCKCTFRVSLHFNNIFHLVKFQTHAACQRACSQIYVTGRVYFLVS